MTRRWPSVGVVIPTWDRPGLLRRAVAAVLDQDYPGPLRVLVCFDRSTPDPALATAGGRPVQVLANWRTPGIAGARNTGILALDSDLVAFCDDDDTWAPGKLAAQVRALRAEPGADFATCAIEVDHGGRLIPRLAGRSRITHADLVRSRMAMPHSSGFLVRRAALLDADAVGLVAEDAPGSQNEDWDLLLRAARRAPIVHLDAPLVRVRRGGSRVTRQYDTKISALHWMLDRHPEIGAHRRGAARVYGQLARWSAAAGNRHDAWAFARAAVRNNWREPRAVIALAATTRAASAEQMRNSFHRRRRGI